jgi:Zn-finger nucleic acid-binding protein
MTFMCPACNQLLIVFELEGVEIDHCVACGGTWLDAGELDQLALLAGAKPGRLAEVLEQGGGDARADRRCVRCPSKLRAVKLDGIEIDRCGHGHGLWFDRGEVATLVGRFTEGEEGRVGRLFGDLFAAELKKEAP